MILRAAIACAISPSLAAFAEPVAGPPAGRAALGREGLA